MKKRKVVGDDDERYCQRDVVAKRTEGAAPVPSIKFGSPPEPRLRLEHIRSGDVTVLRNVDSGKIVNAFPSTHINSVTGTVDSMPRYVWLNIEDLKSGNANWGDTHNEAGRAATEVTMWVMAANFEMTHARYVVTIDQNGSRMDQFRTDSLSDSTKFPGTALSKGEGETGWRPTDPFKGEAGQENGPVYAAFRLTKATFDPVKSPLHVIWLRLVIVSGRLVHVSLDRQEASGIAGIRSKIDWGPSSWRMIVTYGRQAVVGNFHIHRNIERSILDVFGGVISLPRPEHSRMVIDKLPVRDDEPEPIPEEDDDDFHTPPGQKRQLPPRSPWNKDMSGLGSRLPFVVNSRYRG